MKAIFLICSLFSVITISFSQPDNATVRSKADPKLAPFYHGVASGDPLSDKVIIWTRVTSDDMSPVSVNWRIAKDTSFNTIVKSGSIVTDMTKDFTVKIDVIGLEPNTYYYYEFEALGKKSIIGRTKTTPTEMVDQLRFATVSCSNYTMGFFNAYDYISERNDIDAVIHLGDYIYEYGNGWGDIFGIAREITADNDLEIVELGDYRLRHSIHKLDSSSRKMHQQYPIIATWDDHESVNNSWRDGAENHNSSTEGDFLVRKNNSLTAYYEWMPLRLPDVSDFNRIWRTISYGKLADIFVMDTRLYDRDEQDRDRIDDEDRNLIGPDQLNWLSEGLKNSTATWKILAQQVMMTPLKLPIFDITLNTDQWDGYTAERKRLYDVIMDNNVENVIVLTGDIHTSWANDLPRISNKYGNSQGANKGSVGVEFVTTSVTTPASPFPLPNNLYNLIRTALPHIRYVDLHHKGYCILDLKQDRATNDFFAVSKIKEPTFKNQFKIAYYVNKGERFLRRDELPLSASLDMRPSQYLAPWAPNNPVEDTTATPNIFNNVTVLGIYPNPFVNRIGIQYNLTEPTDLQLRLFDVSGKEVAQKDLGFKSEGLHVDVFDTQNLPKGNYKLNLESAKGNRVFNIVKVE